MVLLQILGRSVVYVWRKLNVSLIDLLCQETKCRSFLMFNLKSGTGNT